VSYLCLGRWGHSTYKGEDRVREDRVGADRVSEDRYVGNGRIFLIFLQNNGEIYVHTY
jgi:hypothetical protein